MPVAYLQPGAVEHDGQNPIGQFAQMVGQALDSQLAGQILREQSKELSMMSLAQLVHVTFDIRLTGQQRRGIDHGAQLGLPERVVGGQQHLPVEQFVQHDRMAGQIIRRPARLADHPEQLPVRPGKLNEQGQISRATRDGVEQIDQPAQPGGVCLRRGVCAGSGARGQTPVAQLRSFTQTLLDELVDA